MEEVMELTLRKILKCHIISWCGNFVEMHSMYRVLGNCPFPQNFDIFRYLHSVMLYHGPRCPHVLEVSEFCPGNALELFWTVHQIFSQSLFLYFAFSNFILYFLGFCILTTSHVIINFFSFSENN